MESVISIGSQIGNLGTPGILAVGTYMLWREFNKTRDSNHQMATFIQGQFMEIITDAKEVIAGNRSIIESNTRAMNILEKRIEDLISAILHQK